MGAAAASTTFTLSDYVIPANTRHLALIWSASKTATEDAALLQFNGDTAGNYNYQTLKGAASTASAARTSAGTSIALADVPTGANLFGSGMAVIPHYANTANHKAVLVHGGAIENSVQVVAGRWANTTAITSITVLTTSSTFVANSIFLLCAVDERFLVEEKNLAADGTVTFSTIPQAPGDLVCIGYSRSSNNTTGGDLTIITVNDDTTDANYAEQRLSGSGTTTSAAATSLRRAGAAMPNDQETANAFGAFVQSVSQHANGVKQPHLLSVGGYHGGSSASQVDCFAGRRANIAAITSLKFEPDNGTNFKSGGLFSLYHVPKRLVSYTKLAADAASVTHTVPSGYEALAETVFARSDGVANGGEAFIGEFNGDTTAANYDRQTLEGEGATVTAAQSAANKALGYVLQDGSPANVFAGGLVLLPAYAETDRHKHSVGLSGYTGPTTPLVQISSNRWENASAITSVVLKPSSANFKGS